MRLPNGYGSITKLKGKRRNPYLVRINTGIDERGVRIRKVLGSYPSYKKAAAALAEYNRDPYDVEAIKVTFKEIYEKWVSLPEFEDLSSSSQKAYKAAFNKYTLLHEKPFLKIKRAELQHCIDVNTSGYTSNREMKNLASKMYQYCMLQELTNENKAVMLKIGSPDKTASERIPYSDEEIDILWQHTDDDIIKIILIFIYTGVRCNELLMLQKQHLHIDKQYFEVIKSKTASGIRDVPIADCIVPFFEHFVKKSKCKWVFTGDKGGRLPDDWFRRLQAKALGALNMKHTTHEARHTCITQMTVHNVNESVIKEIVGHKAAQTFTERVYTHIYMKTKIEAVNTIHT